MPNDSRTARRLLSLLAETSVHAGTGSQLGVVDLPIQRERHTDWPTIYGTGLKGVFRDHAERSGWKPEETQAVFGPSVQKEDQKDESRHSGAVAFSDARLLLFPVRTIGRAFAWITCPLAIARLHRDAVQAGLAGVPTTVGGVSADCVAVAKSWGERIFLEEFDYGVAPSETAKTLGGWIADNLLPVEEPYCYWRTLAVEALVIVPDDDFRDFVKHGTEVVTRVRLDEKKTVARGALWTEENLPTDSLLYSFVVAWAPAHGVADGMRTGLDVIRKVDELTSAAGVVQIGGKETVGRGFVRVRLVGGSDGNQAS